MNSYDLLARVDGLTYRRLDLWCRAGVLGIEHAPGRGGSRYFNEADVEIVLVLQRVAEAFKAWRNTDIYQSIAEQLHGNTEEPVVELAPGISLTVTP